MYEFGELGVLGCMIDGLFVFFRLLFYHEDFNLLLVTMESGRKGANITETLINKFLTLRFLFLNFCQFFRTSPREDIDKMTKFYFPYL